MFSTLLRWLPRSARILALLAGSAVVFFMITPQGRASVNTAKLISQIVPSLPAITWLQPEPIRTRVEVPTPEGLRDADLYRPPGDGPYAATVLFLGVAPAGGDDPRVVDLANGLARSRMVTLVYWSPEKLEGRLHPPDIHNLVAAFTYLQSLPYVDASRVGFAGFCVGASFALMAAAQEEVRDQVAFVNAFGPYYDLTDLARAIGTGTRSYGGQTLSWAPDALTREVATKLLLEYLNPNEASRIAQALEGGTQEPLQGLSAEALAVQRVLLGGTEEQIESAVASFPDELLRQMALISPRSYIDGLTAPVLIMHDRADALVPSGESRRLADALAERGNVRYTEFSLFQHMDPTRPLGLWDQGRELNKLFWHLFAIIRQAA